MFKKGMFKKIVWGLFFTAAVCLFCVLFLCKSKSDIDVHLRVKNQSVENIVRLDISCEGRIFRVGYLISKGSAECLYFSDTIPIELKMVGKYENGSKLEYALKIPQRDMIDCEECVVVLSIEDMSVNVDCKPEAREE